MMEHSVVENVIKQGYLKKGNSSNRISGLFRRNDGNKWFVFTIRQGMPFLEYYDSETDVFSQQPINSFNLSGCQNVKSMGSTNPPSFCIVCQDRVIELVAASRAQMIEWVNVVEAGLTNLGVLKKEISDHVYTVCPAVIRQPRISKEVQDERDAETAAQVASAMAIAAEARANTAGTNTRRESETLSPTTPSDPPRPALRTSPVPHNAPQLPPHNALQAPSISIRSESPGPPDEPAPPPLPTRPHPVIYREIFRLTREDASRPTSSEGSIHPVTDSSNDSDFVSPEVLSQLREIHRKKIAAANAEANIKSKGDTETPVTIVECHETESFENDCYTHTSSLSNQNPLPTTKPDLKPKLNKLKIPEKASNLNDSLLSLDTTLESCSPISSCTSSPDPDKILSISTIQKVSEDVENEYSELPSHSNASLGACSATDTDRKSPVSTLVSKPTPRPRKSFTTLSNGHTEDKHLDIPSNENVHSDFGSTHTKDVTGQNDCLDQEVKDVSGDSEELGKSQMSEVTDKEKELDASKDENENLCSVEDTYGTMYDNSLPPTTMSPPIPPLPPRHDSLPIANSNTTSTDTNFSSGSKPVVPQGTTEPVASSNQVDSDAAPPLPRPRMKWQASESCRRSHPPSAFSGNGQLEIPPMPPRRFPTKSSKSVEETPPALPSRNSQSFFIKRPQITPLTSTRDSNDKPNDQKGAGVKDENPERGDTSAEEGASSNPSGLSRKMLLDRAHSLHTVVSLKQTQAEILQQEISMSSVSVTLTQKSGHGIALVDWNNCPCIVGWNQKDFPSLHGKLHIGDLIFSVNNISVKTPDEAQKQLKHSSSSKIEVVLRRMPHAKVYAIRRNADGQSLGIKRDGGTGEIVYVDPNGLAAQHGLTSSAPSAFGNSKCNWFITEINNRPINLFFKQAEIDHRLAAVGREISIVVQPSDFVYEIRRQFRKVKNYKNYITQ